MAVINYAHRGASTYYPENTLRAFYEGIRMQANGIETDIQCSKDGVLVLFHDQDLQRVVSKEGCIADFTYEELLEMDFGAFRGDTLSGESIVTLEEFLIHFGKKNLVFSLEIKQEGVEATSLEMVKKYHCEEKVIFTSFFKQSLIELRKLDPTICLGLLTEKITAELLEELKSLQIQQICPCLCNVSKEDMAFARREGFSVRFWGIRDEADMLRALELDGDGMTINFPDKLAQALQRKE